MQGNPKVLQPLWAKKREEGGVAVSIWDEWEDLIKIRYLFIIFLNCCCCCCCKDFSEFICNKQIEKNVFPSSLANNSSQPQKKTTKLPKSSYSPTSLRKPQQNNRKKTKKKAPPLLLLLPVLLSICTPNTTQIREFTMAFAFFSRVKEF